MKIVREDIFEAQAFTREGTPIEKMGIGKDAVEVNLLEKISSDPRIKKFSDIDEENIDHISTKECLEIYKENKNNAFILEMFNKLFKHILTLSPSKLEFKVNWWIKLFQGIGKMDLIWNNKKTWVTQYSVNELMEIDPAKTLQSAAKAGPNYVFTLGVDRWQRNMIIWGLQHGATNLDVHHNEAIQQACDKGDEQLVDALLDHDEVDPADNTKDGVRYKNDESNFCIRRAAKKGFKNIVWKLMLDGRSDPSAKSNFALNAALSNNDMPMIKLLLDDERVKKKISYMPQKAQDRLKKLGL